MSGTTESSEAQGNGGFLAPAPDREPVSRCLRCDKETPAGVSLCDEHNRGRLPAPSATQMHATVFVGIVVGVIGFFLIASLAVTSTGPFATAVSSAVAADDGSVTLTYSVANEGADEGVADCRVTRDGVPRPDDLAFRTTALDAGETATFERELAPPQQNPPYDTEAISVVCT